MNQKDSPPLSKIELADIEIGEREIASGKLKTYNNIEDFIKDLHAERLKFKKRQA